MHVALAFNTHKMEKTSQEPLPCQFPLAFEWIRQCYIVATLLMTFCARLCPVTSLMKDQVGSEVSKGIKVPLSVQANAGPSPKREFFVLDWQ